MKLYELKANNSCKKNREFAYHTAASVADHVAKSSITIRACKELIFGRPEADVKKDFHEAFQDLYYPTEMTRDAEEDLAWREITRYVGGELSMTYRRVSLKPMPVDIGVGEDVIVDADFVAIGGPYEDHINNVSYDGSISVVKLHAGKPRSAKSAKTDLAKYAMLKYARSLVSPGKTAALSAVDIYLKRNDDVGESAAAPHFETNFWAVGGNNVIALAETYVGGSTKKTENDVIFEPIAKAFLDGHEAEECSEEDCKACRLNDICHYAEPPIRTNKEHVQKTIHDLMLTPSQDDAIEYEKGIVRINAGAGVGKTVVVALRTVTLLNKGVKPEEILLITFTNAAAEEMRARIQLYNDDVGTGEDISGMKICTFNAFGDDILKVEYAKFGFSEPPKVIDDVERSGIIANLLKTRMIRGLNYRQFIENTKYVKGAVWIAAKVFSIVKKGSYTILDLDAVWDELGADCRFATKDAVKELIELYDDYDAELRDNNLIEFADRATCSATSLKR